MKISAEKLTSLKLFEGLSLNELHDISEQIKFHHRTLKAGKVVKEAFEKCEDLIFVYRGSVYSELKGQNTQFVFTEEYNSPCMIEPYNLFGLYPRFSKKYVTKEDSELLSLNKKYIIGLLYQYNIFNLNYINTVCSCSQYFKQKNIIGKVYGVKDKIVQLALHLAETNFGDKKLYIKQEVLADIIGETKLKTSQALHELEEENRVVTKRGIIIFKESNFTEMHKQSESYY